METGIELANRFREVLLNGTWIANTNYKLLLSNVDYQIATQTQGNLNSIAALVFHINYYIDGLNTVFEGGDLNIHDKYSFDVPPIFTENEWQNLYRALIKNAEIFADHIAKMDLNQLEKSFVLEQYGTYRRNIEGVIEHSYYHLGQISLLLKLFSLHNK
jgi:uncharacterized damage-inducible protein DinB